MKTIAVFAAVLAVAVAAPQQYQQQYQHQQQQQYVQQPQQYVQQPQYDVHAAKHAEHAKHVATIVKETLNNNIGLDGYQFAYEQDDGQKREESAQLAQVQTRDEAGNQVTAPVLRVTGSYSYVNPQDGQTYTVTYVADETGFHPQGAHLPVA